MGSVSNLFDAVGVGSPLTVRAGDTLRVTITPDAFTGTLLLQQSESLNTWKTIDTFTIEDESSDVLTRDYKNESKSVTFYRFEASVVTDGEVTTAVIADLADNVFSVKNKGGVEVFSVDETGAVVIPGTLAVTGALTPAGGVVQASVKRVIPAALGKPGGSAGWVTEGATNVSLATCPADQSASTLVIPITGLNVGDTITAFNLVGQIDSAGNAVTVDAALRKMTAATAGASDASLGAITQISVTADTIISASKTLTTPEVVGADESFYVLVTATTGSTTDVELQAVGVTVTTAQ